MGERTKHRFPPMFAGQPSWLRNGGISQAGTAGTPDSGGKDKKGSHALTGQSRLLLLVNALFAAGNALSGTFVNVYLWKAKNDFALIGWFAVAQQLSMALSFWIAGKWVKEHNKMNSLRAGVGVAGLFYGLVLLMGSSAANYIWILGPVMGIASGLFWLAFNVVYFEVTDPGNRDRFNGWAGLLGSGVGMVAPWISGWLITRMASTSGYRLIFSISLGVFVLGGVISFFLKRREVSGRYGWTFGFRQIFRREGPWRRIFLAMMAQGVREGVFGFMIALMVFISTQNELKVGLFSLMTSAVAFFSFYLIGRFLKVRFRHWGMLIGALAIISVILPFFWSVNFGTLLIFGIGTSLFFPMYSIPITSVVFDMIGKDKESAEQRVEYVVLRETGLNVGRMLGTLAFITVVSFTREPLPLNILLLAVGSSPLIAWLFIRKFLVEQRAEHAGS